MLKVENDVVSNKGAVINKEATISLWMNNLTRSFFAQAEQVVDGENDIGWKSA